MLDDVDTIKKNIILLVIVILVISIFIFGETLAYLTWVGSND